MFGTVRVEGAKEKAEQVFRQIAESPHHRYALHFVLEASAAAVTAENSTQSLTLLSRKFDYLLKSKETCECVLDYIEHFKKACIEERAYQILEGVVFNARMGMDFTVSFSALQVEYKESNVLH